MKDISNDFFLKKGTYGYDKKYPLSQYVNNGIIEDALKVVTNWTKDDIGQAAITSKNDIIRYEDSTGTNNLIKKVILNKKDRKNSYLFIKIKKLHQDNRIDLPTFGFSTLKYLVKTNIKYIVLEADYTVVLDKAKVLRALKKHNITLLSLERNVSGYITL